MLSRTWTTSLAPGKEREYDAFARETSLPMFTAAPGCLAVLMDRSGATYRVTTVWRSRSELADFESSETYRSTVQRILASGLLHGEQRTEVTELHLGWTASSGRPDGLGVGPG